MNHYLNVWKKFATFDGRARRQEYWFFVLGNMIVGFVFGFLGAVTKNPAFGMLSSFYSLATLVPSLSVGFRRIHDTGRPGWFLFIPIFNVILLFTEGVEGPNDYGPDPKQPERPSPPVEQRRAA